MRNQTRRKSGVCVLSIAQVSKVSVLRQFMSHVFQILADYGDEVSLLVVAH